MNGYECGLAVAVYAFVGIVLVYGHCTIRECADLCETIEERGMASITTLLLLFYIFVIIASWPICILRMIHECGDATPLAIRAWRVYFHVRRGGRKPGTVRKMPSHFR